MIDLAAITQARKYFAGKQLKEMPPPEGFLPALVAAVDAVLEADQIKWCTTHDRWYEDSTWKGSTFCDKGTIAQGPCKIVSAVVVPVETPNS